VRDNGRRIAMIQETAVTVMGTTQRTRMRTISEPANGDVLRAVTIDLETGEAMSSTMPMQDVPQVNASIAGMSKQMFSGGRRTGEKGSFAGHDCEYWETSDSTMRACVGSLGIPLYMRMQMAGMTIENTVTELRLGDGGPDSAFAYDASRVVEVQSSQDMVDQMMGR
jgi:hypothetical protein